MFELSATNTDNILNNDLTSFISSCDERTQKIIHSRFGIDGYQPLTLEETGQEFKLTRERIRQLEAKAINILKLSLSLTSTVIRQNVKQNLTHEFKELYPTLSKRFTHEKELFLFMEHVTDAQKNEFKSVVYPDFNTDVLEDWFAYNKAPMSIDVAVELLSELYGCNSRKAENALHQAHNANKIIFENNTVTPIRLNKITAAAQAALSFPDGVNFRDIHSLANEQQFCLTKFPLDRQEHGIQGAVDNGLLYLSTRGQYRHTNYFPYSSSEIKMISLKVKDVLSAYVKNDESLHLKIGVYEKSIYLQTFDYFDVRHVIREYGEQQGIYFAGKSGADTVSLSSGVTPKGQQQVILDWFRDEQTPKTKEVVAKIIRSSSINHASFYISELVSEGKLVKIDLTHYTTPEFAFSGAPIESIMEISAKYIKASALPIEIGAIANQCNALLHIEKTKGLVFISASSPC